MNLSRELSSSVKIIHYDTTKMAYYGNNENLILNYVLWNSLLVAVVVESRLEVTPAHR